MKKFTIEKVRKIIEILKIIVEFIINIFQKIKSKITMGILVVSIFSLGFTFSFKVGTNGWHCYVAYRTPDAKEIKELLYKDYNIPSDKIEKLNDYNIQKSSLWK
jgi:hypothetical protein